MNQLTKNTSSILFTILIALLIVVSFISFQKFSKFNDSVDALMHTNLVKSKILEIDSNLKEANSGQRGYLLTKNIAFLQPFNQAEQSKNNLFTSLEILVQDNPQQRKNLKQLKKLVNEKYFLLNKSIDLSKTNMTDSLLIAAIMNGKNKMDDVENQIKIMLHDENILWQQRVQVKDRSASITPFFLLILSLFSIFIVTFFFFRLQNESSEKISIKEKNILLEKANKQIEASENLLRSFANNMQNLAWIATRDGMIYWYNQRWLDYTGLTLEEMYGWGWKKVHHPDHVDEIVELTKELWIKDKEFELTFPLRRHDGEYHWFLTRACPVKDANGNTERWIGTNTDITEQRSFTEQLEINVKERTKQLNMQNQRYELAETVGKFGSYTWNMERDKLEYSDNLYRLLDCEPKEFVPTFEKFLSFIHPDDLQQVISNGEQTKKTGELVETPYRIVSKMGKTKYFRSSGNFSGSGENRLLIGTVQDISKDVSASKNLETKNLELENANAELASFNYVASHDLQEPLRKIQGFSKRIMDDEGDKLSDTTKDYFNRIRSASQRMQNLIESLLSFSLTNLSEVVFEKTDLNQTLIEVQATLHNTIKQKNAIIDIQILPTLNAVTVQMHQLFLNLIANSLKYSKPNVTPHIKITAEKVAINEMLEPVNQNGEFWKIIVSDNGIGFEQQYENKIFELFQRTHDKTEYEGTGIGLAICKKIVHNHHGTISAIGQIGIGATFTFFLLNSEKS